MHHRSRTSGSRLVLSAGCPGPQRSRRARREGDPTCVRREARISSCSSNCLAWRFVLFAAPLSLSSSLMILRRIPPQVARSTRAPSCPSLFPLSHPFLHYLVPSTSRTLSCRRIPPRPPQRRHLRHPGPPKLQRAFRPLGPRFRPRFPRWSQRSLTSPTPKQRQRLWDLELASGTAEAVYDWEWE